MSFIYFFLGLFLGWFFLPAPAIAYTARDWLVAKVPFLAALKRDTTPRN